MAVDLNADLGERPDALNQDALLLASVTSANLACGFHAGTTETMRFVCSGAAATGVAIGAHVSYRDREGFGRRELEVERSRLTAEVLEQLETLVLIAGEEGAVLSYLKPHGALYNRCAWDRDHAGAVIDAAAAFAGELKVLGLPGSALLEIAAAQGLEAVAEGYVDRGYRGDGGLVQRDQPGAILADSLAVEQAWRLATGEPVRAHDGSELALRVRSLCLHSDTPGSTELARQVRGALERAGVELRTFA